MKILLFTIALLVGFVANNDLSDLELSMCYTQEGYIAAISEQYLDDVVRYSVDNDYKAIQSLLAKGVVVQMKKGVKVYLVDAHIFSGKVEFRVPGQTQVLWTVTEGLRCN